MTLAALLLPCSNTWNNDDAQKLILERTVSCIQKGFLVGAICGSTLALADLGTLNNHLHTSNSLDYLTYCSKRYSGTALYQNALSISDKNIITASSAGSLLCAKQIIDYLNVYSAETNEAWYQYYLTGDAKYYTKIMSTFE